MSILQDCNGVRSLGNSCFPTPAESECRNPTTEARLFANRASWTHAITQRVGMRASQPLLVLVLLAAAGQLSAEDAAKRKVARAEFVVRLSSTE